MKKYITCIFQIKITNRQTGHPVNGPDEQGEICIKSPQCFLGYLDRPDLNNSVSNFFLGGGHSGKNEEILCNS